MLSKRIYDMENNGECTNFDDVRNITLQDSTNNLSPVNNNQCSSLPVPIPNEKPKETTTGTKRRLRVTIKKPQEINSPYEEKIKREEASSTESESEESDVPLSIAGQRKIVQDTHGYSIPIEKIEFLEARKLVKSVRKELKTAQQKNRRLDRRVRELKIELENLKHKRKGA